MRRLALASALLLGLAGCSLSIDPDSVPPPVTPGCVPVCNATLTCGVTPNNCGTTCAAGSGCTPAAGSLSVQGGLTMGAVHASGVAHQVQGALVLGAAAQTLQSTTFRIEQGTLR